MTGISIALLGVPATGAAGAGSIVLGLNGSSAPAVLPAADCCGSDLGPAQASTQSALKDTRYRRLD
jgi:hypothetical protein